MLVAISAAALKCALAHAGSHEENSPQPPIMLTRGSFVVLRVYLHRPMDLGLTGSEPAAAPI